MQGTGPAAFRSHSASDSACSRRASNARTCSIATSSHLSSHRSRSACAARSPIASIASIASISAARACGRAISSCRISLNPLFVKSHPIQRHHSQSRGGAAGGEPADRDIFLRIGERTPHTNTTFTTWSARRARNKKPFRPPGTKGRRLSWFHPRSAHENDKPHARSCRAGNVALTRQPTTATARWFDVGRTGGLLHMTRAEDGSQPVAVSRCRGSCGYLSRSSPLSRAYHARPLTVKPRPLYLAPRTRQSSVTASHPV